MSIRSGWELISIAVFVLEAVSITRPGSMAALPRLPIFRAVRWPMQSTWVFHRPADALRRIALEGRVNRGDHPVALGEHLVRHVERAVGANVDLNALEQPERRNLLVHRVDLPVLLLHATFRR